MTETARSLVSEEDAVRAHWYGLLAHFLARPPVAESLEIARSLGGDDTPLGKSVAAFAAAARAATPESGNDEFHQLFYGVGRGELVPHGSFYLTGFLNEKPLADLRDDLARLGVARADDVKEPEDHIAALCDVMAGMIRGDFGPACHLDRQAEFFDKHLAPWAEKFFEDLEGAKASVLYMPLGSIGRQFMAIEGESFRMLG
ncbi:molecular chaperone TorD family protein [Nisaea acidiphila]|uniref:Molecular chaperone TorD family protein n=1 Tax=Nisaea acidiphila TaxID=1862145 RepID=A0A9J7AW56_9PROT|nr:molecular chaperone TorD family protein [Nisaea acidiphila]UUX52027.1 molecular chaperone TorD family protein [Nisaea acidiphila]